MATLLEQYENWLTGQYSRVLGISSDQGTFKLRYLSKNSLKETVEQSQAYALAIEDNDIGWLFLVLPYHANELEIYVNQALGIRSRLLRESNYTGNEKAADHEDRDSTWRVGLIWLVGSSNWQEWQAQILELRRESGVAEELSLDAIKIDDPDPTVSFEAHGMPKLLLHTRALLTKTSQETEKWISVEAQVAVALQNFSARFDLQRSRSLAEQIEAKVCSFIPTNDNNGNKQPREFSRFSVKNFRNLKDLNIAAERDEERDARALIIFGPNGTGKSSLAEAISLAAFQTSPQLEDFMNDDDIQKRSTEKYLNEYLRPINANNPSQHPIFTWADQEESIFTIQTTLESKRSFEGVVLNQEDSLSFTNVPRSVLATRVLQGYSRLADEISEWINQEERRATDVKLGFTRRHGLVGSIKLSETAYNRLAQSLLNENLERPSKEFLDWLAFLSRRSDTFGHRASRLSADWIALQSQATRLVDSLTKVRLFDDTPSSFVSPIRDHLDSFNKLLANTRSFREQLLEGHIKALHDQLDLAATQIESWGEWLSSRSNSPSSQAIDSEILRIEIEKLAKERTEIEKDGREHRSRLEFLDQSARFIDQHWNASHPDVCPLCETDVSERQGMKLIVSELQSETNSRLQKLRVRHVEIQKRQKEIDDQLKLAGTATCPVATEDQSVLQTLLTPFLAPEGSLEEQLKDSSSRKRLKEDLLRMRVVPNIPRAYTDPNASAEKIADAFVAVTREADRALNDPQAINSVKKAFEQILEGVLKDHLPSTLGKVWTEITLSLTTATWLLPAAPKLTLSQRGKSLSVNAGEQGQLVRYLYNAAERHVLGLSWFFTYFLAKRRFDEAWILLDDPAQEMDQPSFRELLRFWETLLRLFQKAKRPITLIAALHQEDRALDAARATNGKLYILGWQKEQLDQATSSTVKRVVLLAPGYHPLKPQKLFN